MNPTEQLPRVSENQHMITQMVRDFGFKEIEPYKMQWDEDQYFPVELFKKLGSHGLMGVLVPHEYGGSGFGYHEYVTAIVEVAKIDGAIGLSLAAHNSLCTGHILQHASEEQKQKYLPKLAV
ncbi:MAG: acyl-CoA dehydrogenase family protein, partial [Cytophagales bacterium]|nr:acyl-CoA dehydrogenase family protein [Cytophagales bacterium]